ncbi:MAG: hypothetical protein P4L45_03030 [Ignavibacteriaceae bacterium]|nr:hypothetical protein [Ignavibacteriaceae bacterium]
MLKNALIVNKNTNLPLTTNNSPYAKSIFSKAHLYYKWRNSVSPYNRE